MKCVGYDVEFQRILARNYRQYEQRLRAKMKAKARTKPVTGKRKRGVADPAAMKEESTESGSDIEVIETPATYNIKQDSDSDVEALK